MPTRHLRWNLLRIALGALLLAAATMKSHELATQPILQDDILHWRPLLFAVVQGEFLLSVWLFTGFYARWVWRITLVLFVAFAVVTFYKAISGEASCGCFGQVQVDPWYTLLLDLVVLALLIACQPSRSVGLKPFSLKTAALNATLFFAAWLALAAPAAWSIASFRPNTSHELSVLGRVFDSPDGHPIVVLEPETWIDKPCPLFPYIENFPADEAPHTLPLREKLQRGDWDVLLYHHDCTKCREVLPQYESMARLAAEDPARPQIALIEVPSFAEMRSAISRNPSLTQGRLCGGREWYTETPARLRLRSGIVTTYDNSNDCYSRETP